MKRLRRQLAFLLVLVLSVSLLISGCGKKNEPAKEAAEVTQQAAEAEAAEPAEEAKAEATEETEAEPAENEAAEPTEEETAEAAEAVEETAEVADETAEEAEAEADAEPVPLPEIGDEVSGFKAVEIREFPQLGATLVWFEHEKTGAKLMYAANDDINRAFQIAFRTDAIDNTGLPHVFEHSCLSGSEKYPSDSLFFNLIYQSYNTFMNAMTMDRATMYPVASLSEAQLLKFADLYTDSVLHPMILKDESIYRTEAWRYRLADPEDDLTLEGTVYSEMLGANTIDRVAMQNALRDTMPGSMIGNSYGGDTDYIPDMTWDMLKDYHKRYYHPSNSVSVLYGSYDDYTSFLDLLDGYFSEYDKKEYTHTDDGYTPITEAVENVHEYPAEKGAPTEHAAQAFYTYVCTDADISEMMAIDAFAELISANSSPVMTALDKALPYGNFSCYLENAGPEPVLVFSATGINEEDAKVFKDTIESVMPEIAKNGFDERLVDSVMADLALTNKLMREDPSVGISLICMQLSYTYAVADDPWYFLDYLNYSEELTAHNEDGEYAALAERFFVDNPRTALSVTVPKPGEKEIRSAQLAEDLAQIKASMSEEEIEKIVEETNRVKEEEDVSGMIAQLQAVTVDSLPEEIKMYEVSDSTDRFGIRHIDALASVDGVGETDTLLDISGLDEEALHYMKLYIYLVGELGTKSHDSAEIKSLTDRYLKNWSMYISIPDFEDLTVKPYLRFGWTALDEDLQEGYELMKELLYETDLDDTARLLDKVRAAKTDEKSTINGGPYNVLLSRLIGRKSERVRLSNYLNNLDYYAFLEKTEKLLSENPEEVQTQLTKIQEYLNNRNHAVSVYAGSSEGIELNRAIADEFFAGLDKKRIKKAQLDLPIAEEAEGLIYEGNIQYNILAADYETLGVEEYDAGLEAFTALVADMYLIPLLRDQYGVYTPMFGATERDGMYLLSYRDPNVKQTFEVYDSLYDLISDATIEEDSLNGYIMSSYSGYAMPDGELTGAVNAAMLSFTGWEQTDVLEKMEELKAVTPEKIHEYAELLKKLSDKGCIATAGGAAVINDNADLYDAILNPFGVKDNSEVELADVSEDDPQYEAVRYVYENGIMGLYDEEEQIFGAGEDAVNADLLAALYVLAGGSLNADEALEAFAGIGLVPADTDLEEALTGDQAAEVIQNLASAFGAEYEAPSASEDTITRGDLAVLLKDFADAMSDQ